MISQTLSNKLLELRLTAFREGLREQSANPHYADLSFEERLLLLVELECTRRSGSRIQRRLKLAEFPLPATLEDLDFSPERGLDRPSAQYFDPGRHRYGKIVPGFSLGRGCLPFRLCRALCAYFPLSACPGTRQTGWFLPPFPSLAQQNRSLDPG